MNDGMPQGLIVQSRYESGQREFSGNLLKVTVQERLFGGD